VDALVRHFIPLGAVKIPPNVEQAAAMLPVADKKARSPAGVGGREAGKIIGLIEFWWTSRGKHEGGRVVMSEDLYRYRQIFGQLGSGAARARAYIQKEGR